jgi:hypothetical protein
MGNDRSSLLGLFGMIHPLRRWERDLKSPNALSAPALRGIHKSLRGLRSDVDRLALTAETELLDRVGQLQGVELPDQCDWAERAAPWRTRLPKRGYVNVASPLSLGAGVTLFHDATHTDLSMRQDPVRGALNGPAYGLIFEVYRFDGSFLSLVQDLPEAALLELSLAHFFRVQLTLEREQRIEVYVRLNIQHGPNHEQIVRQFAFHDNHGLAEFDLAYTKLNERRIEKAWLDLILEGPEMNRIAIWDMVMLRAPRADI